jgi:hypothetical protein
MVASGAIACSVNIDQMLQKDAATRKAEEEQPAKCADTVRYGVECDGCLKGFEGIRICAWTALTMTFAMNACWYEVVTQMEGLRRHIFYAVVYKDCVDEALTSIVHGFV